MARSFAFSGNRRFIAEVAPRLESSGFARVDDAAAADVVISYCSSQNELEDLYFGDAGFVSELAPGSLLIDLSPMTPSFAREVNAVATVSDLDMVEAPLVMVDMVADDVFSRENIWCFAAGEDGGVDRAREVLNALFGEIREVGGPGAAQLARAAHTLQVSAQVISAIEADALCRATSKSALGASFSDALTAAATPEAQSVLGAVRADRFDGAYTVEQFMAELSSAIMAADDVELILPQAEAAMHLLELLAVIGGSDKSPASLALVYGEEADCARNGLDWTRAEKAYGSGDPEGGHCDCGQDHDGCDEYDDFDEYGYEDPYSPGFDYSSN